jgi:hypothetical protein
MVITVTKGIQIEGLIETLDLNAQHEYKKEKKKTKHTSKNLS